MKRLGFATAILIAVAVSACATAKKDLTVPGGAIAAGHTTGQVEAAIEDGLKDHRWVETGKQPGRITAKVEGIGKGHPTATVAIVYSASTYSIEYVDSTGLSYDEKTGSIHGNYKKWTNNLRASIDKRLQ